ncbi:ATP-binding protein [Cupriavidus sp. D39]|uniref:sensor histidine kinase n=1 Tax=Cupriavidus sp. D39 TaxID=2997877 RepID=UPI00226FFB6F|nr:ATP-binding protein [Cupriavidus sp. D39]MCY0854901.1 ATP-binding protein [Cupriavidus sp. D39]
MSLEIYRPAAVSSARRALTPLGTAIALIVGVWLGVSVWAGWDRGSEVRRIEVDADRLAFAVSQHVEQTLMVADQWTSLIGGAVVAQGPDLPLTEWTRNGHLGPVPFLQTSILDADGLVRASTNRPFEPPDLIDRESFRIHANNPRPTLLVSKPLMDRASGRWVVQLSKGIVAPGGHFKGVVVVSLDSFALTEGYKGIYLGNDGLIGLLGTDDFIYRARWSPLFTSAGQQVPADSAIRTALATASDAEVEESSPVDGVNRIYGVHRLARENLAVVVGYNLHEALTAYRNRLLAIFLIASFVSTLILFLQWRQVLAISNLSTLAKHEAVVAGLLQEARQQLHAVSLAVAEGVAIFDKQRVIDNANPGICDLLEVSVGELLGATPGKFVDLLYRGRRPGRDSTGPTTLLAELNRNAFSHEYTGLIEFDIPDSPAYVVRIVHSTNGAGCALSMSDATVERRRARTTNHFLATATHTLKTPLTNIVGYAELLAAESLPIEKHHSTYQTIRSEGKRSLRMVSDLLELSRLEAHGTADMNFQRVDLVHLARDVVSSDTGVTVTAATEPTFVTADYSTLSRALRHLLDNALKHSPVGKEVTVLIASAPEPDEHGKVRLSVIDRGTGMKNDEATQAFDKFYRGRRQDGLLGSGLGLALVREIVELHDGQISLETEFGKGTTVTLSLPRGSE